MASIPTNSLRTKTPCGVITGPQQSDSIEDVSPSLIFFLLLVCRLHLNGIHFILFVHSLDRANGLKIHEVSLKSICYLQEGTCLPTHKFRHLQIFFWYSIDFLACGSFARARYKLNNIWYSLPGRSRSRHTVPRIPCECNLFIF